MDGSFIYTQHLLCDEATLRSGRQWAFGTKQENPAMDG